VETKAKSPFHVVFDETEDPIKVSYPSLETGETIIKTFPKTERELALKFCHAKVEALSLQGPTQLFMGKDAPNWRMSDAVFGEWIDGIFEFCATPVGRFYIKQLRPPKDFEVGFVNDTIRLLKSKGYKCEEAFETGSVQG
jgi:hypothetical protein